MSEPLILNRNEDLGITRLFHFDDDTETFTIETVQDVSNLIELNRAEFDEHTSLDRFGDMNRVASIPMNVYFDLKNKGITDDTKAMKRWLNDPDNRFFRTRPGRV